MSEEASAASDIEVGIVVASFARLVEIEKMHEAGELIGVAIVQYGAGILVRMLVFMLTVLEGRLGYPVEDALNPNTTMPDVADSIRELAQTVRARDYDAFIAAFEAMDETVTAETLVALAGAMVGAYHRDHGVSVQVVCNNPECPVHGRVN